MTDPTLLRDFFPKDPILIAKNVLKAATGKDVLLPNTGFLRTALTKKVSRCFGGYIGPPIYSTQGNVDSCMLQEIAEECSRHGFVSKEDIKKRIEDIGWVDLIKEVGDAIQKSITEIVEKEQRRFLESL